MTAAELQKFSTDPEALMDQYFLPWEYDAGAFRAKNVIVCPHVVANMRWINIGH